MIINVKNNCRNKKKKTICFDHLRQARGQQSKNHKSKINPFPAKNQKCYKIFNLLKCCKFSKSLNSYSKHSNEYIFGASKLSIISGSVKFGVLAKIWQQLLMHTESFQTFRSLSIYVIFLVKNIIIKKNFREIATFSSRTFVIWHFFLY